MNNERIKALKLQEKLMDKLMTLFNYIEMSRVTSTPLNFLLTRGQQIKVSTQLHKKALEYNYIIPTMKIMKDPNDDEEGYEGAFVLDPIVGFHNIPKILIILKHLQVIVLLLKKFVKA